MTISRAAVMGKASAKVSSMGTSLMVSTGSSVVRGSVELRRGKLPYATVKGDKSRRSHGGTSSLRHRDGSFGPGSGR